MTMVGETLGSQNRRGVFRTLSLSVSFGEYHYVRIEQNNLEIRVNLFYWLLRAYVFACGLIVIFEVFTSHFIYPTLYYYARPIPPVSQRFLYIAPQIGYCFILLLPHRWTLGGWLFKVKLALLSLISICITFFAVLGIIAFFEGGKHWVIIPTSLGFLLLALSAPATLILRKQRMET